MLLPYKGLIHIGYIVCDLNSTTCPYLYYTARRRSRTIADTSPCMTTVADRRESVNANLSHSCCVIQQNIRLSVRCIYERKATGSEMWLWSQQHSFRHIIPYFLDLLRRPIHGSEAPYNMRYAYLQIGLHSRNMCLYIATVGRSVIKI